LNISTQKQKKNAIDRLDQFSLLRSTQLMERIAVRFPQFQPQVQTCKSRSNAEYASVSITAQTHPLLIPLERLQYPRYSAFKCARSIIALSSVAGARRIKSNPANDQVEMRAPEMPPIQIYNENWKQSHKTKQSSLLSFIYYHFLSILKVEHGTKWWKNRDGKYLNQS